MQAGLPSGVELTLQDLRAMAAMQQKQVEAQQEILAAKEQRLKFLKEQECLQTRRNQENERIASLRVSVERGEPLKVKSGGVELDAVRSLFWEKEKELAMAVSRVEELAAELDKLRTSRLMRSATPTQDVEKLNAELKLRTKMNEEQMEKLQARREILGRRNNELDVVEHRIEELTSRLKTRHARPTPLPRADTPSNFNEDRATLTRSPAFRNSPSIHQYSVLEDYTPTLLPRPSPTSSASSSQGSPANNPAGSTCSSSDCSSDLYDMATERPPSPLHHKMPKHLRRRSWLSDKSSTSDTLLSHFDGNVTPTPNFPVPQVPLRGILKHSATNRRNHKRVAFDPLALLLDSALDGDLELVKHLCGQISNISACNEEGITALHNAVCAAVIPVVHYLVSNHADVNAADSDGWTPLHCAASCNNLELVRYLVENGASVFACTFADHETPSDKCEEDEVGYEACSQYLYSIQEKLGIANRGIVYAVYDYASVYDDELSFHSGDALCIIRRGDECERDWWWSRRGCREGYVPKTYLAAYPRRPPSANL